MIKAKKQILITGGAGFIGSHLVRYFVNKYPEYNIINLDSLSYAGNLANLESCENADNYVFEKVDILDEKNIERVFETYGITDVIHLAAESHVDRSITNPVAFVQSNVLGTVCLLNYAKKFWGKDQGHRFYHVSTDEVYGSLGEEGYFTETTAYDPRSPYSASKAASDHFVRAYLHTFELPCIISNCSNNYGPNQFPEKLIPLMINNIVNEIPLPIYGDGSNIRDWLWVEDHVEAIDLLFHQGRIGETYNIGGNNEISNIDIVKTLIEIVDRKLNRKPDSSLSLIRFVKDRPGHDQRYAIDATKIKTEFNWEPQVNPKEGLEKTVDWYLSNSTWLNQVTSGDYMKYYENHYAQQ